jgi:hypothetical protein
MLVAWAVLAWMISFATLFDNDAVSESTGVLSGVLGIGGIALLSFGVGFLLLGALEPSRVEE